MSFTITVGRRNGYNYIYKNRNEWAKIPLSLEGTYIDNPDGGPQLKLFSATWYKKIKSGKYVPMEDGTLKKHIDIRKKKAIYRIEWIVSFDRGRDEPEDGILAVTIQAYVATNEEQKQEIIANALERKINSSVNYQGGRAKDPKLILFERIDDNEEANFSMIPMQGLQFALKRLYNFTFKQMRKLHPKCVPDYLLQLAKLTGGKSKNHVTLQKLRKQFSTIGINIDKDPISPADLLKWHSEFHNKCCSIYILDGLLKIKNRIGAKIRNGLCIEMICTDNHCFGVFNNKKKVSNTDSENVNVNIVKKTRFQVIDVNQLKEVKEDLLEGRFHPNEDIVINIDMGPHSKKAERHKVIDQLFADFLIEKQLAPYGMQLDTYGQLGSFCHPLTQQVIMVGDEFAYRKELCERLYETYPYHEFKFRNQSVSQIADSVFLANFGEVEWLSHYTKETQEINTEWCTSPFMCGINEHCESPQSYQTYDHKCHYVWAILNMSDNLKIPVFEIFETWEPYDGEKLKCGFYFIDQVSFPGGLWDRPQTVPHFYVKQLLKKGYITKDNIRYQHLSKKFFKAKVLKDFAKKIIELFPNDDKSDPYKFSKQARDLIIQWIGRVGMSMKHDYRACITSSKNEVDYFCIEHEAKDSRQIGDIYYNDNCQIQTKSVGDKYFIVQKKSSELKLCDSAPVMRSIHAMGKLILLNMLEDVYIPGVSVLETVRVDCISGWNLRDVDDPFYHKGKSVKALDVEPMKRFDIPLILPLEPFENLPDIHFDNDGMRIDGKYVSKEEGLQVLDSLMGKSLLLHGDGGNQKTVIVRYIYKWAKENKKSIVVLTTSHKASTVIKRDLPKEERENVMVLASYFHKNATRKYPDIIVVDEGSQVGTYFYRRLYHAKLKGTTLIFSGDFCQTGMVNCPDEEEVDGVVSVHYDLYNNRFFRQLVDNQIMEKKFYPSASRNCPQTQEVLQYIKKHGYLPPIFKEDRFRCKDSFDYNMSFLRKTKETINKKFEADYELKHHWKVGTKVTGIENVDDGVCNGQKYVISKVIHDSMFELSDPQGNTIEAKKEHLELGYCDTIHRYQGDKMSENYNILDLDHQWFSRNELITAIGRSEKIDYIHLDWTDRFFPWRKETQKPIKVNVRPVKFGYIYRIWYDNHGVEYIGKSESTIEKRMESHIAKRDNPVRKYGEKFQHEELAKVMFIKGRNQLKYTETYFIHDSCWFSEYENVNVDQKANVSSRTKTVVVNDISNQPVDVNDPVEIHLRKGNDGLMAVSIKKLEKLLLADKFGGSRGQERLRYNEDNIERTEELLIGKALRYLEQNNVTDHKIIRHYEIIPKPAPRPINKLKIPLRLKITS